MKSYTSYDDGTLVRLLTRGDEAAFTELYQRWFETVYSNAFKRLHDPDKAKDVCQDVFLKLWNNRLSLSIKDLKGYLFIAVRNGVLNLVEKESRFTPIDTILLHLQASAHTAEASVLRHELLESYHAMVSSLPEGRRSIFRMYYEEEMDTAEIAERLNLSRKTVQNQLRSAVTQLRASLGMLAFLILISQDLL